MYQTTNDKEKNKIIFEKIEEIKEKTNRKYIKLIENFENKPNLPFRLKIKSFCFFRWQHFFLFFYFIKLRKKMVYGLVRRHYK
jgi:hypothetical protein